MSTQNLYTNIYSNISYNNQELEIIQNLSTDQGISKMWYTHPIEYYLEMKGTQY